MTMGRKCSVAGCKTGYDSQRQEKKIPVYGFPVNSTKRNQWLASLPNKLKSVTVNMGVCALHWPPDATLVRKARYFSPADPPSIFSNHAEPVKRGRPRLKQNESADQKTCQKSAPQMLLYNGEYFRIVPPSKQKIQKFKSQSESDCERIDMLNGGAFSDNKQVMLVDNGVEPSSKNSSLTNQKGNDYVEADMEHSSAFNQILRFINSEGSSEGQACNPLFSETNEQKGISNMVDRFSHAAKCRLSGGKVVSNCDSEQEEFDVNDINNGFHHFQSDETCPVKCGRMGRRVKSDKNYRVHFETDYDYFSPLPGDSQETKISSEVNPSCFSGKHEMTEIFSTDSSSTRKPKRKQYFPIKRCRH